MEENTLPSVFDEVYDPFAVRRKYMIPKWMRVFAWIFAVLCPLIVLATLISFALNLGVYNSTIYGFYSRSLISMAGYYQPYYIYTQGHGCHRPAY